MPGARSYCGGAGAALAVALGLLAPGAASASDPGASAPQPVALIQRGHQVSGRMLERGAQVLSYQVNRQLRRFWTGPPVDIRVVRGPAPASWPTIELTRAPPPPRTAGYHALAPTGVPFAVVYLRKWGSDWTVGASHELLEMLQDPRGESISSSYLEEICDPVQFVWYSLHGMYVADFVTPAWFTGEPGPWDIGGRLHAPQTFGRGGEEDYHFDRGWAWIGPGAQLRKLPKPLKLRHIPR